MQHRRLTLTALIAVVASFLVTTPTAAVAADCVATGWVDPPGEYGCVKYGDDGGDGGDGDGDGGSGGPSGPPPCDLSVGNGWAIEFGAKNPGSPYCRGADVCVLGEHGRPWAEPPGTKPEGGEAVVLYCLYPDGGRGARPIWSGEEPPSLAEQAQEAIGNIDLGTSKVGISPAARTLVNLDTWYWLDGGMPETATGSSAFGLVAIATFQGFRVTTGDGSTVTCPYVTTEQQAKTSCTHTYRRSSGGRDYTVSAVATYGLRFEINGRAITNIPGAPATLDGPVTSSPLEVAEVQTRVTRTR